MQWRDEAARLTAEIKLLEKRLRALRLRRNSITPLYTLPHEIVELVLLFVQQASTGGSETKGTRQDSYHPLCGTEWVRCMQSCRRMREVALGSGVLWSAIDLEHKNHSWTDLCLTRAGNNLLCLNTRVDDLGSRLVMPLNHAALFHRSRCIHLRVCNRFHGEEYLEANEVTLRDCLDESYPQLSSLEIFHQSKFASHWDIIRLDQNFLGGGPLNFTRLTLDRISLSDVVPSMPALKHLSLSRMQDDFRCKQLRTILNQTPNLDALNLENLYDADQPKSHFPVDLPDISKEDTISLLHLVFFSLTADLAQVSQIIQLFPNVDARLDMHLKVLGEDRSYWNQDVYMAQVHDLALSVQAFLVRHLLRLAQAYCMVDLTLEMSTFHSEFKVASIKVASPPHDTSQTPPITSTIEMFFPLGFDTTPILECAHQTESFNRAHISPFASELSQVHSWANLIISNVGLYPDDRYHDEENCKRRLDFEEVLARRATAHGTPLKMLRMRYYGTVGDAQWLKCPPLAIRKELESKWRAEGWVAKVFWDDQEELRLSGSPRHVASIDRV